MGEVYKCPDCGFKAVTSQFAGFGGEPVCPRCGYTAEEHNEKVKAHKLARKAAGKWKGV